MSDDKTFLARWSRRKRDAAPTTPEQPKQENAGGGPAAAPAPVAPGHSTLPFDLASLPPIGSIGAGSDIRAFLEAGVPADLTRAALRRAWSSDPQIRDFVGLSENSWDFNAPGAMPGFGPIDKEEVGRVLKRLLGEPDTKEDAAQPSPCRPRWMKRVNATSDPVRSRRGRPYRDRRRRGPRTINGRKRWTPPTMGHSATTLLKHRNRTLLRVRTAQSRHGGVTAVPCRKPAECACCRDRRTWIIRLAPP